MSSSVQQNKTNHGCPGAASSSEVERGKMLLLFTFTHTMYFLCSAIVFCIKNSLWIRKVLF